MARVMATIAPLLAVYATTLRWVAVACAEATLTMAPPPPRRISGTACLAARNMARTLTSSTSSQTATGVVSAVP